MEQHEKHSVYKGFEIVKVTQDSGRVTYDIYDPQGEPWEWAAETLRIARATIDSQFN